VSMPARVRRAKGRFYPVMRKSNLGATPPTAITMFENLLQQFGYPALVLGVFVEGEVSVLLAAYLALRGYLSIEWVVACAFCGTYASDQLWFHLGRHHGRRIVARNARWQRLADKALDHLRRYPDLWVLGFRFIYGMRTVMPLAIGISGYSWRRYLVLDAIGVAIWASTIGYAAYHLGAALQTFLGDLKRFQLYIAIALIVLLGAVWLHRRRSNR